MNQVNDKAIVDGLLTHCRILTLDDVERVFDPGALAIQDGRIAALGPEQEIKSQFSSNNTWDAGGKLVLPGLINTHAHLFQIFLRGIGKDLPLMDWLSAAILPNTPQLEPEDCYLAAMVGCMEAVRTGTTTLLDYMYVTFNPEFTRAVVRAFSDLGIRGIIGRGISDHKTFPDGSYSHNYQSIENTLSSMDSLRTFCQDYPLVHAVLAPPALWRLTRECLIEIGRYSREHDILVTLHTSETTMSEKYTLENYGLRPFPFLSEIGLLNDKFLGVHCVKLDAQDIALIAEANASVSHNPAANMVLASGVSPIPELLARGVSVGLATDGAASNDSQSIIEAMKLSALLQKVHHLDASILGAKDVLRMATSLGAKAIHMQDKIGTLEPGKEADLIILDMLKPNTTPCHDPISSLVYSGSTANVDSVVVNGKFILQEGRFTNVDEDAILKRASSRARDLLERAQKNPH
jgi:5-methylthioadenosine/S-adenosylhomocysteine deaminase